MLNDSLYLNYFIKQHKLKKFFSHSINEKEILAELILLTLINNEYPFTANILNFKIIIGSSNSNIKTYNQILNEIIVGVKKNINQTSFNELINNYDLKITLNY